ncbi:hypothetical protein CL689_03675 [Candidatus Saccharibacteria bacterium]|nr:hypothetical protein [Candidatus Saccharibacteria bacterium]
MLSLRNGPVRKSLVKPAPEPEPKSEEQSISLNIATAFFGLPDLSHISEIIDHADKLSSKLRIQRSSVCLNQRDSLDPRKALTPR